MIIWCESASSESGSEYRFSTKSPRSHLFTAGDASGCNSATSGGTASRFGRGDHGVAEVMGAALVVDGLGDLEGEAVARGGELMALDVGVAGGEEVLEVLSRCGPKER